MSKDKLLLLYRNYFNIYTLYICLQVMFLRISFLKISHLMIRWDILFYGIINNTTSYAGGTQLPIVFLVTNSLGLSLRILF